MKDNYKVFIDTNILIYSIYGSSEQKQIIGALLEDQKELPVISTQVLKEFTNASFKKKLHRTPGELKEHLTQTQKSYSVSEVSVSTIIEAISLKDRYQYSFYDTLILASALENKCKILYSEDLQHGQVVMKKLQIINPFK